MEQMEDKQPVSTISGAEAPEALPETVAPAGPKDASSISTPPAAAVKAADQPPAPIMPAKRDEENAAAKTALEEPNAVKKEKKPALTVVMENPTPSPARAKKKSRAKPVITMIVDEPAEAVSEPSSPEMLEVSSAPAKLPAKRSKPAPVAKASRKEENMAADTVSPTDAIPIPAQMPYIRIRMRGRGKFVPLCWFLILFVAPSSVVCWYYHSVATPMYVSEMKLSMRQGDNLSMRGGDLLSTIFNSPTNLNQDGKIIVSFIHSAQLLGALNRDLELFAHYSAPEIDPYARLSPQATVNDFMKYWIWAANPKINSDTGLIEVSIKAFSPEMAYKITASTLAYCEYFVNQLNSRVREDSMQNARNELARAEERLRQASQAMESFRAQHGMMDLQSSSSVQAGIVGGLETELAKVRAEIESKAPFLAPSNAEMRMLTAKAEALDRRIEDEKKKIAGTEQESKMTLSSIAAQYESCVTEQEFARNQYKMAMTAVESARLQFESKKVYLVPIDKPMKPDESLYPKRLEFALAFIAANFAAYLFLSLIGAAIMDHLGF